MQVLKDEVSSLAPDAAAFISKGDGLVMTVHIKDPGRAERIKNDHQDKLRSKWHQVMAEVDARRVQAQKAEEMLKQYNKLIAEFEEWFRDVPAKLEQANNYEGQLETFTEEFDTKHEQVQTLNNLCAELKKLNVGFPETVRYSINTRWQEVSSQFKRYSGGKDKEKLVTDKKVELVSQSTFPLYHQTNAFLFILSPLAFVMNNKNFSKLRHRILFGTLMILFLFYRSMNI